MKFQFLLHLNAKMYRGWQPGTWVCTQGLSGRTLGMCLTKRLTPLHIIIVISF